MTLSLHGLRTVIYPSVNLDDDKAWWTQSLGTAPYFDQPFYVGFNVGGYELGLLPDATVDDGALVYWGVDNVALSVEDALSNGATIHTPAAEVGEGIVTATVRTPSGTIVGLIYNPHFKVETTATH